MNTPILPKCWTLHQPTNCPLLVGAELSLVYNAAITQSTPPVALAQCPTVAAIYNLHMLYTTPSVALAQCPTVAAIYSIHMLQTTPPVTLAQCLTMAAIYSLHMLRPTEPGTLEIGNLPFLWGVVLSTSTAGLVANNYFRDRPNLNTCL
jgi:hypothetical protein